MLQLVGNWWAFVLRGALAILFGLLTFFRPGITLVALVYLFGFYAVFEGAFNIVAAFRRSGPEQQPWWALLLEGIFSLIAGFLAFFMPGITAMALLWLIAAWAIATGAMEIAAAIRLRRQITGEWVLALSGVLSILFGILLLAFPGAGALTVVLWIGAYATVFGMLLIALGIRLRTWVRRGTLGRDMPGGFPPGVAPGH
jgi:uncharacterized membrane protein HdeD (DUF308 family)